MLETVQVFLWNHVYRCIQYLHLPEGLNFGQFQPFLKYQPGGFPADEGPGGERFYHSLYFLSILFKGIL